VAQVLDAGAVQPLRFIDDQESRPIRQNLKELAAKLAMFAFVVDPGQELEEVTGQPLLRRPLGKVEPVALEIGTAVKDVLDGKGLAKAGLAIDDSHGAMCCQVIYGLLGQREWRRLDRPCALESAEVPSGHSSSSSGLLS
jgi:hypothetical protein